MIQIEEAAVLDEALGYTDGDAACPAVHVGLLWHTLKSENLGVGALTLSNAQLIADAARRAGRRPVFHLIGIRGETDYSDELPHPSEFANIGYKALVWPSSELHRSMRYCDIMFDIGGGDSFSDIYAWRRFGLILGSKLAAAVHRAPLVLSPQTIGPFTTARARLAARAALALAQKVFARDEMSRRILDDLGAGSKSALTTDVAFALPYSVPAGKAARDLRQGTIKIGINVSALLYRRDIAAADKISLAADYPALVDTLIERLLRDPAFEVHLIPHVLAAHTPYEDDYAVAEALKARYPALVLPARFRGPSQAKSYIADCDFFVGSRMHATIAAISSGTAVVPLGYSRKFSGLFGSLGYAWNADMTQIDNEGVMGLIERALADLPGVRADAVSATAEANRRLKVYTDYLDKAMAVFRLRHA